MAKKNNQRKYIAKNRTDNSQSNCNLDCEARYKIVNTCMYMWYTVNINLLTWYSYHTDQICVLMIRCFCSFYRWRHAILDKRWLINIFYRFHHHTTLLSITNLSGPTKKDMVLTVFNAEYHIGKLLLTFSQQICHGCTLRLVIYLSRSMYQPNHTLIVSIISVTFFKLERRYFLPPTLYVTHFAKK